MPLLLVALRVPVSAFFRSPSALALSARSAVPTRTARSIDAAPRSSHDAMTKVPATPAAASLTANNKANGTATATATPDAPQKKSKMAASAHTASAAADAAALPQSEKKHKQKKSRPSTAAAAADADGNEEDEITLFHPATAVAAQPEMEAAAASAAAAAAAAESGANGADGEDDEHDVTSSSFFSSLIRSQTPALLSVLGDLQSKVKELRKTTLRPLLSQLGSGSLPTSEGMSFLEMKNQVLLQYLTHLVLFVMGKLAPPLPADSTAATAASQRQSSIVKQLVYLRAVLEKLRPLDKKLKYQIDKMAKLAAHINLKAVEASQRGEDAEAARAEAEAEAQAAGGDEDTEMHGVAASSASASVDPLSFRPNPSALLAATAAASRSHAEVGASSGTGLASGSTGLYRPPRISATQLDDADKATSKRNKDLARAAARAKGNAYLSSLRADLSERPEERSIDLDDLRPRHQADLEREEYETTNLLRLTDTRADKARRKEQRRVSSGLADLAEGGEHDDFRDMRRLKGGRGEMEGFGFGGGEEMTEERVEELRASAAPRKRRGGDDEDAFDDPTESRHAKKRRGPNGKNSFGSKFASRGGGGRGGRGGGRGGKGRR